ncbi:MAG: hypothetical protein ACLFTK_01530 [Anaerolineales bacterium]
MWGNEPDPEYGKQYRRRKFRDRFGGTDDDAWGAADAEDFYDDGSADDLYYEHHAAGLSSDRRYESSYSDRQVSSGDYYDDTPADASRAGQHDAAQGAPLQRDEMPRSAQALQRRFQDRPGRSPAYDQPSGPRERRAGQRRGGIDALFEPGAANSRLTIALLFMIFSLAGVATVLLMAYLAFNSLTRHLGL